MALSRDGSWPLAFQVKFIHTKYDRKGEWRKKTATIGTYRLLEDFDTDHVTHDDHDDSDCGSGSEGKKTSLKRKINQVDA